MSHPENDLVLVTGGAGFIGSNVVRDLAADHRVVVCDHYDVPSCWRYLVAPAVEDLIVPAALPSWLDVHSSQLKAVVHMGAISATTETDVARLVENNVRMTLDLWRFCADREVTFIYASSAATYGDGLGGFVDDDSADALAGLRPLNPYGWSKHLVDRRLISDVGHGRPSPPKWAGLKFFNVYGPNEGHKGPMRSVVHQIYPSVRDGLPVRLFKSERADYADGGQLRDFVYVKDCCATIRNMIEADALAGIYNVGTGVARSFADLARAVGLAVGAPVTIDYIDMPGELRGRYQYETRADMTKLRRDGLAPEFCSLEDGIADYVSQYLKHELD